MEPLTFTLELTAIAAIAAGVWSYYKFRKMRVGERKLEIELIPAIYHNAKSKVIDVSIRLKNIGSVAIYSKVSNNPQCLLEAKAIPNKLKDSPIFWDDNNLLSLFPPIEFLKEFESWYPNEPYIIEPETTEIVHIIFSISYDALVFVKVSFVDNKDNLWTATKIIDSRMATSCNSE